MSTVRTRALVAELVQSVPALEPLLKQHVRENGVVLPHVFFSGLVDFVEGGPEWERGAVPADVLRILEILDLAMDSPDPRVPELVSVSFLEDLNPMSSRYSSLRRIMGPRLLRQLLRYE